MSTVTVTGSARAAVAPDRALVRVTLTHLAPQASAALDAVSGQATALGELLDRLGIERRDWATGGVVVNEESEWRDDRSVVVGQRATATASITVRDIAGETLGVLLRDVVDGVGARVDTMSWVVDDQNPARIELMAAAARDARVRADAYAAALGLAVSGVDAVSEQPLGDPEPRAEGMMVAKARMMTADSAPVPVNPGDVELAARVHVRFHVIPA